MPVLPQNLSQVETTMFSLLVLLTTLWQDSYQNPSDGKKCDALVCQGDFFQPCYFVWYNSKSETK